MQTGKSGKSITWKFFAAAIVSGLLLSLSWPSSGFAPLIFISFVPLLLVEDFAFRNSDKLSKGRFFLAVYTTFFLFNLLTTWWVRYASLFGAVAAVVCNALFMAIVFYLFHRTRRRLGSRAGYFSLPVYWIAFEHLHMDWDLSWPWLTLGNVFAGWPKWIQWYEFTGVLGGTLWIWVINIMLLQLISFENKSRTRYKLILLIVVLPLAFSIIRYHTYEEEKNPVGISVIQPDIDPYNEKFTGMSVDAQLARILSLATNSVDSQTSFVIAPETALPEGMWEEELDTILK